MASYGRLGWASVYWVDLVGGMGMNFIPPGRIYGTERLLSALLQASFFLHCTLSNSVLLVPMNRMDRP
ncbi:hypothetical protein V8F33_006362 [Rhypophila sp. PSN 637]